MDSQWTGRSIRRQLSSSVSIIQAIIGSNLTISAAGGGNSESGTPGSSIVWESGAVPLSGSAWVASIGSNAVIATPWTLNTSGGYNGILLSPGYIDVPVNLNQGHWTVEMVCALNPTSYWAAVWGNDFYNSNLGYLAYLDGPGILQVGSPLGTDSIDLNTQGIYLLNRAYWAFTNTGGTIAVYRNGVQLARTLAYVAPSGAASNNLFIGSRHNNNGVDSTDPMPGTYYFVRVRDYGLDQNGVLAAYGALQSPYGV